MALSGSITKNFYNPYGVWGYSIILEWEGTQSITNNTTSITAKLYLRSNGSGYTIVSSVYNKAAKIIVDGVTSTKSDANVSIAGNQKRLIHTYERTITHNSDGTRSVTMGGSLFIGINLSGGYVGTVTFDDKTFTLDTIPRASSITSFPNFTIGNNFTVTIQRNSGSFNHDLTLKVGSTTIRPKVAGVGTSYTYALTTGEQNIIYQAIPSSTSATITLTCQTKKDGVNVGSAVSKTAIAYVPNDDTTRPDFTTITHSDAVAEVSALLGAGKYAEGLSRLNLNITGAVAKKYATLSSYQITFDGNTYNARSAMSNVISRSGNFTITGKVTDSRGLSRSRSVNVNAIPYTAPIITHFNIDRCDKDGNLVDMGECVRVAFAGIVSSLDNKNTLTYRIKSSERGLNVWEPKVVNDSSVGNSVSDVEIVGECDDGAGEYGGTSSYDFRFEISDKFYTTFSLLVLPTGRVVMSWDDKGVGINKVREQGVLDVGGDVYCDGLFIDGLPVSSGGGGPGGQMVKHGNEYHNVAFATDAALNSLINALHIVATSGKFGDLKDIPQTFKPSKHGNEAHDDLGFLSEHSILYGLDADKPVLS